MRQQQGMGFFGGAVVAFALTRVALVACTPTNVPDAGASGPTVQAVCAHLVSVGCGHDVAACVVGLSEEVDAGRQSVNLACAYDAGTATAAARCSGIGACPP
jgi:hypothetical protein